MKLRVLSDLHLEFSEFVIGYKGEDVLILAGDICPEFQTMHNLVKQYIHNYDTPVILVLGNHDYWYSSLKETRKNWEMARLNKLYLLDNNTVKLGDILFAGTTLWTDATQSELELISWSLGDMWNTSDLTEKSWAEENKNAVNFLSKTCEEHKNERIVVITHHLPSYKSIGKKYVGNALNPGFANKSLDELIVNSKIELWIHGHTHSNVDYVLGETRVLCNPRGYVSTDRIENPEFDPNLIVEI